MSSDGATPVVEDDATKYARLLPQLSLSAAQCVSLMAKWPAAGEHEFHRAFRGFTTFTRQQQQMHAELNGLISVCYRDRDAVNRPFEAVDALFENVDHLLDSARGVRIGADQQEELRIGVTGTHDILPGSSSAGGAAAALSSLDGAIAANQSNMRALIALARPQDRFRVKPDNFAQHFRHFVACPENTTEGEFHRRYVELAYQQQQSSASNKKNAAPQLQHPLGDRMQRFSWQPQHMAPPKRETVFLPMDGEGSVPVTFIDEPQQLADLVAGPLSTATEIAIDVEHHQDHSYLGFTCLVQISTRGADFVLDTLALREDMWRLAPVFEDPAVVKVLHMAEMDVRWLQRDFGLFLVNMFDTGIALQTLRMPCGLAFLVDHVCQVKLDKQYQTADWRMRPLSPAMLRYAQQDTHYLLYCYDRLRSMLAAADTRSSGANLLMHVLHASRDLAAEVYRKPPFDEETTWREQLGRSIVGLYPHQLGAIRGIFNWREKRAQLVDTSPESILSNGQLLSIGCRLPTTAAEVLRMANPATAEVRKAVKELLAIIEAARVKQQQQQLASSNRNGDGGKNAAASDRQQGGGAAAAAASSSSSSSDAVGVHIPMTGTLPSVVGHAQMLETSAFVQSLQESDGAAASVSASAALPAWMTCFSTAMPVLDVACQIPVPMPVKPRQPERRQRADDDENNNNNDSAAKQDSADKQQKASSSSSDDDADEQQKGNAPPEAEKKKKEKHPLMDNSDDEDDVVALPAMPKSLQEEFGGLGRKTRKQAGGAALQKK